MNHKNICCMAFLFFSSLNARPGFESLKEVTEYAQKHDEFPEKDNENWLNPVYNSFHKKNKSGSIVRAWNSVLVRSGFKKGSWWSAQYFKTLIRRVTRQRELNSRSGRFIEKIIPSQDARFVILGDIQGAFHSLVRDLNEFKKMGIIDDTFKIIKPNHYFVFNGDLINRSPYTLETLTLALKLLAENPDNVFYIRGNHEDRELWQNYGLRRELIIRASHVSNEKIPLNSWVKRFFRTLPLALYLKFGKGKKSRFIRISHYGRKKEELNEEYFAPFLLEEKNGEPQLFNLKNRKLSKEDINVRVIIKGISRSQSFETTDGLKMLLPDKGAIAWNLLSAPTSVYRTLYGFFNDVFSILDVGPTVEESFISLFKQDIRDMDGFEQQKHNLISGERVVKGRKLKQKKAVSPSAGGEVETVGPDKGNKILVGCITDLTKSTALYGIGVTQGLSLRFNKENRTGGINGKNIEMVVLDHGYDPKLAVDYLQEMLSKHKTDVIIGQEGSPTLNAMLPFVESGKVLMLFPYTGSSAFRKPEQTYMGHFRTSYRKEAQALARYAVEKRKARRFVIFYQNDAYGLDGLKGAREVLKKYKEEGAVDDWVEAYYLRNTTDVAEAVKKIKTFQPEVIILCSVNAATSALIREVGVENLANVVLMGISPLGGEFVNFVRSRGLEYLVSNVVPDPYSDDLEIVREYRDEMQRYSSKEAISIMSLEGYIDASIFIEILKRVQGTITKEKIRDEMEKMQGVKYKDLTLNFHPEIRGFSKDIWIQTDKEWMLLSL